MRLGHGPRRTVVMLWAWTALLSGVALLPVYTNEGNALVPFVAAALALALYALVPPGCPGRPARAGAGRATRRGRRRRRLTERRPPRGLGRRGSRSARRKRA